jgi:hypothetical protein
VACAYNQEQSSNTSLCMYCGRPDMHLTVGCVRPEANTYATCLLTHLPCMCCPVQVLPLASC